MMRKVPRSILTNKLLSDAPRVNKKVERKMNAEMVKKVKIKVVTST